MYLGILILQTFAMDLWSLDLDESMSSARDCFIKQMSKRQTVLLITLLGIFVCDNIRGCYIVPIIWSVGQFKVLCVDFFIFEDFLYDENIKYGAPAVQALSTTGSWYNFMVKIFMFYHP